MSSLDLSLDDRLPPQLTRRVWRVIPVPTDVYGSAEFCASLLLPGLCTSFHQRILERCYNTIRRYRGLAAEAARQEHEVREILAGLIRSITPTDGVAMARLRGQCQLPFWSQAAMVAYRKHGLTHREIAELFEASPRAVSYVLRRVNVLKPDRVLTHFQQRPPGIFR